MHASPELSLFKSPAPRILYKYTKDVSALVLEHDSSWYKRIFKHPKTLFCRHSLAHGTQVFTETCTTNKTDRSL